jgi:hypothetical protein
MYSHQKATSMESKFSTIEQKLDLSDNSIIINKKKSPLEGIIALALGATSIALVPVMNTEEGVGGALLIVLAITFVVWGMLTTFIRRKYYYYVPGSSKIRFKEIFFESENFMKVSRIIESDSYTELAKIPQTIDKGIKLRLAYTPDKSFSVIQLLKYVPYEYEVQSNAKELNKEQGTALFNALNIKL